MLHRDLYNSVFFVGNEVELKKLMTRCYGVHDEKMLLAKKNLVILSTV